HPAATALSTLPLHDAHPIWSDLGSGRDLGALDMAEPADARALGHLGAGPEDDEGLNGRACADVRAPGEVDGVRGAHGHALRQERSEEHTSELQACENLVCRL